MERPLKVAYLTSRFPVTTETFILYEVLELLHRGMDVEVFPLLGRYANVVDHPGAASLKDRTHHRPYVSWALVAAQLHWLRRRPRAYARAWWEAVRGNWKSPKFLVRALYVVPRAAMVARELAARGVTHVHAHWATHPTLAAYVIRRLTGTPYSFTCHAHDLYVDRAMLAEKIDAASFVATISEYNRSLLLDLYGAMAAEKVAVIRCGVDTAVFHARPARRQVRRPFTFVCVASLRDYKGQRYLLDACAKLKGRGRAFRCLLVGEGEDRRRLAAQAARLGLNGGLVQLLGQKSRDEVQAALAGADAVVLPSIVTPSGKKEGIPVALMEALASELPVVATAISGIPELVSDGVTGLLVPEKDSEALANAMERLMRSGELCRKLGHAGRCRVLTDYNLERNVDKLEALLRMAGGDACAQEQPGVSAQTDEAGPHHANHRVPISASDRLRAERAVQAGRSA